MQVHMYEHSCVQVCGRGVRRTCRAAGVCVHTFLMRERACVTIPECVSLTRGKVMFKTMNDVISQTGQTNLP